MKQVTQDRKEEIFRRIQEDISSVNCQAWLTSSDKDRWFNANVKSEETSKLESAYQKQFTALALDLSLTEEELNELSLEYVREVKVYF